jgi:argininosuccinate lyase
MEKLWGGRFEQPTDQEFERFNSSLSFDRRLLSADITVSVMYCRALRLAGVLTEDEAQRIESALRDILQEAQKEPDRLLASGAEDIHSYVEARLVERVGEIGYKLHTGRSRNDQVSTDLRIFLRGACDDLQERILEVEEAIVALAEKHPSAVMPGYTHGQRAQPILLAHFLLALVEMLERDRERIAEARRRINVMPLGSGALAGTSVPIDRWQLARDLGFDDLTHNSVDAVSDRDFVLEFLFAASLVATHLSRMAEDLIRFCSAEYGFFVPSDVVTTGSSLMPQKKNPDALELIRGKAGRIYGHLLGMLTVMKGLPLGYNKDMQEDKEPIFDSIDTLEGCLRMTALVFRHLHVNEQEMIKAAGLGYLNATDLADYLARKGMPFRQAHHLVGQIVRYALEQGRELDHLALEEYRRFSGLIEEDVYAALSLDAVLASRRVTGGTAPEQVREALDRARERLRRARKGP